MRNMIKLFVGFWALVLSAGVSHAQDTFLMPSDVPPYVEVVPTFAAGTTPNLPIDARVTPPTYQGMADIPSVKTGKVKPGTVQCVTIAFGGTCQEAKVRFTSDVAKINYDDPIVFPRQPGASHCHMYWGNYFINAYTTFATLRTNNRSTAAGADLNASGYWAPCLWMENLNGDGKDYAQKPEGSIIIYYEESDDTAARSAELPLGVRYVTGKEMHDPAKQWYQDAIDAANAQPGTPANRYSQFNPLTGATQTRHVWKCGSATNSSPNGEFFVNPDGSDPFGGNCNSGDRFWVQVIGAKCWDGVNPASPGGYRHVIPGVWDTQVSQFVCPNNYYEIASLQLQIAFTQEGHADRVKKKLSCKEHYEMKLGQASGQGACFHTDWFGGWDGSVFIGDQGWQKYCIGVNGGIARECDSSAINDTETLITDQAAPDGRNPQVGQNANPAPTSDLNNLWQIGAKQGPVTVPIHDGAN